MLHTRTLVIVRRTQGRLVRCHIGLVKTAPHNGVIACTMPDLDRKYARLKAQQLAQIMQAQ